MLPSAANATSVGLLKCAPSSPAARSVPRVIKSLPSCENLNTCWSARSVSQTLSSRLTRNPCGSRNRFSPHDASNFPLAPSNIRMVGEEIACDLSWAQDCSAR